MTTTYAIGAPTNVVEELTGRPAEDFETIARGYVNDMPEATPSFFGMLGAMGLMMKIMVMPAPNLRGYERKTNVPILEAPVLSQDSEEWLRTHGHAYAGGNS